jgi:hypothetical protein
LEQKPDVKEDKTYSTNRMDFKCLPFDNICDIKTQLQNPSDKENKISTKTIGRYRNSTQFDPRNQCFDYELETQLNKCRPIH